LSSYGEKYNCRMRVIINLVELIYCSHVIEYQDKKEDKIV